MNGNNELMLTDDDTQLARVEHVSAIAIAKSEVEAQLDAAHRYRRALSTFTRDLLTMATLSVDVAESCIYTLPRAGKNIAGPSIRLAEMAASAWGNLHLGCRVVDTTDTEIVVQGVAWDLERNVKITTETRRRITDKNRKRYNDDMITTTGNAAASIALRNAVFRVIPRAYIDAVYQQVRKVAVGDAKTLADKRADVVARLQKLGVDQPRVLAVLGCKSIEDIGLEQLELLIGLGTAVKAGERSIDDAFPAPVTAPAATEGQPEGKRMSLGKPKAEKAAKPSVVPDCGCPDGPVNRHEAGCALALKAASSMTMRSPDATSSPRPIVAPEREPGDDTQGGLYD